MTLTTAREDFTRQLLTRTGNRKEFALRLATVHSVGPEGTLEVLMGNDPTPLPARHLGSYDPVEGDPVQLFVWGADLLVLGSVKRGQAIPEFEDRDFEANPILESELADEAVRRRHIIDRAISTIKIAEEAINEELLANSAITETKISDDAVTTLKVRANSIIGDHIQTRQILAHHVVTGTITANEIAGLTITGEKISGETITADKMVVGTITAASGILADAVITTAKIADAQITTAKIQSATINSIRAHTMSADNITAGTISATVSMTSPNINAGGVTINSNGVTLPSGTGVVNRLKWGSGDFIQGGLGGGLTLRSATQHITLGRTNFGNVRVQIGDLNEGILSASHVYGGIVESDTIMRVNSNTVLHAGNHSHGAIPSGTRTSSQATWLSNQPNPGATSNNGVPGPATYSRDANGIITGSSHGHAVQQHTHTITI